MSQTRQDILAIFAAVVVTLAYIYFVAIPVIAWLQDVDQQLALVVFTLGSMVGVGWGFFKMLNLLNPGRW